jgi:hypothetical protein
MISASESTDQVSTHSPAHDLITSSLDTHLLAGLLSPVSSPNHCQIKFLQTHIN